MSLWPYDESATAWPPEVPEDFVVPAIERIVTSSVEYGKCQVCGDYGQTGISDRDGKRICPSCLHKRQLEQTFT